MFYYVITVGTHYFSTTKGIDGNRYLVTDTTNNSKTNVWVYRSKKCLLCFLALLLRYNARIVTK